MERPEASIKSRAQQVRTANPQFVWRRRSLWRIAMLLCGLLLVTAPAQEKKLTIYAPQTSFSVNVTDRDGKEYVGLVDLLEPLGTVSAKPDGKKWKLRFTPPTGKGQLEAQFTDGNPEGKVRGKKVNLGSRFVLENGRGLIPVHALTAILAQVFQTPADLHEAGRRLFIGNPAVHYNAELKKLPARLVVTFSAPVNPFVATEPGKLHMVFTREPVMSAGALPQSFDDRTITGLAFGESNGAAELTVSANAPLLASFSDGGKTITITAAPQSTLALPRAQVPAPISPPAVTPPALAPPKFLIVIDPGHGGNESGAALGDVAEKDFNLQLARRLRAELEGRGLQSLMLRDSDTAVTLDQRALVSNGVRAAVYVSIHAAMNGAGVRVYTSDLPSSANKPGSFLPWESSQAAYLNVSSAVASGIADELGKRQVPALALAAPVRPLNNIAAAAVAVEVAPPSSDAQGIKSPVYQQSICSAIGGALVSLRPRLEAAR